MGELDQWGSPAFVRSGTAQAALNAHAASGNGNFTLNPEPMRTLLLAAVLPTTSLCAQTTFAPVGASWAYNGWHYAMSGQLMIMQPQVNGITSVATDTIQGRLCTVLTPNEMVDCNYSSAYITMEEDTLRYWNSQLGAFDVLYVMNTPPGGSWVSRSPFGDWYDVAWTVTDTTTIAIGGHSLHQLHVNGAYGNGTFTGKITERLGFDGFLFPWDWGMAGGCDLGDNSGLRCYHDPEISWINPQYTQCDLGTGVSEHSNAQSIMVSPSILEVGGSVHVTLRVGSTGSLIDATDRTVAVLSAEGDLTIAHTGLYFIRAISEQGPPSVAHVLVR